MTQTLDLPTDLQAALDDLASGLTRAVGDDFVALVLYGALAQGRHPDTIGSVDVLVALRRTDASVLAQIAPVLGAARRSARVSPMITTPKEIGRAADAFPVRFRSMQRRHVLLAGTDPFDGLEIHTTHLRLRVEQELRNLALRMRRHYVANADDALTLAVHLNRITVPLSDVLRALCDCAGGDEDIGEIPSEVLPAAAQRFDLDAEPLARLLETWRGTPPEDARSLFTSVLAVVERATRLADELEQGA